MTNRSPLKPTYVQKEFGPLMEAKGSPAFLVGKVGLPHGYDSSQLFLAGRTPVAYSLASSLRGPPACLPTCTSGVCQVMTKDYAFEKEEVGAVPTIVEEEEEEEEE